MKKLINLVACYLLLATLAGCSCSHSVDPSGSGKVVGTITDDTTKKPIEGASVLYSGNEIITKKTDASGNYEITIPTGTQKLSFSKDGYESKTVDVNVVGEGTVTLNVALTPKGANTNVAKVEIFPASATLKIGESKKFEIKAFDRSGTAITNFTAETTINPANLGTIASDGTFTAKDEGEGTLTVKVNTASATAQIVVEGNYPASPPHLVKEWDGPKSCTGFAVGSSTLYAENQNQVMMYDLDGNQKGSFGSKGTNPGQFISITALCASNGKLYVGDSGMGSPFRIQVFDLNGNFIIRFGPYGNGTGGTIFGLWGLSTDSLGNTYSAEGSGIIAHPQQIQKWDPQGKWLKAWGRYGQDPGKFYNLQGICIDSDGNILVADSENRRIQKFTTEGQFLKQWSTGTITGGLAWSAKHKICYVVISKKVNAYTKEGKFLFALDLPQEGWGYPIDVDENGNLYVIGFDTGKILKYSY